MMMRFAGAVFAAALLLGTAQGAETTLTMATADAIGSLRNQAGNWVRDELARRGGDVQVRHIEGPALGNAGQIRDQVAEGSVDIMGTDAAWLTPYSDFLKATSFAFVFDSAAHLRSVFQSRLVSEIWEQIAQRNRVRVLATAVLPARAFFTREPLRTAEDFRGLKIRSPQLDVWIESYKSFGANPTPVSWHEVFLAMKTGLVDGAQGLPADVLPNQWHLAAPEITDLADMFAVHVWFINEGTWRSLSPTQQAELQTVLDHSTAWLEQRAAAINLASIITMLREGGGRFASHDPGLRSRIADAVGQDHVVAFPEADRRKLRDGALAAARGLEGTGAWWGNGVVDQIQALE